MTSTRWCVLGSDWFPWCWWQSWCCWSRCEYKNSIFSDKRTYKSSQDELQKDPTYTQSYLLRVLLDPLALLVLLVKMVLVDPVERLAPWVPLETLVWLDQLAHLERRDPVERLVPL